MLNKRKNSQCILRTLAVCVFVLILGLIFGVQCPVKMMTGMPCPGCGMTRAWLALLRLDLNEAFGYHPLFWLAPALAVEIALYTYKPNKRRTIILSVMSAVYILVYVVRLILGWRG